MAEDVKKAHEAARDAVNKRMDEIYNSIADTLIEISANPKYARMTGPEALRYAAGLIRRAPKDANAP
jgi:hypothetical protein